MSSPKSSLPVRLGSSAFWKAPSPNKAVLARHHGRISRVSLGQSKSPSLDTSVTSSGACRWQAHPPPFLPLRPQKHVDVPSTPTQLYQSTLLQNRHLLQNTVPMNSFLSEKLRYMQQQQEAMAAVTAHTAASILDHPRMKYYPWRQKKIMNTPRNPGAGKGTRSDGDAVTKAAAATKAEDWKDTYLPTFKLCMPDHPVTFSCEPEMPGDEETTPVRLWTYDWEFERSITLREREEKEKEAGRGR